MIAAVQKSGPAWSAQQEAIFEWFARGRGNLVVRARAGTGKTTTILEGLRRAPESRAILCAFNKRIAVELQQKLGSSSAEAKTLHAIGFRFVARAWPGVRVDGRRARRLAEDVSGEQEPSEMLDAVAELATKAREILPLVPSTARPRALVDLAYRFDLAPDEEFEERGWTVERLAIDANAVVDRCAERDGTIDFADMVYLPLVLNVARGIWDLVCVDEAQDMSPAQLELTKRIVTPRGRMCVIGDDRQAVYGFRGADPEGIDRTKAALKAAELGLTVTYRCPQKIVALARELVPDYQAAPSAPMGEVGQVAEAKLVDVAKPGDFILSRTNAPLARVCLRLLRHGVRARIEGRDIARGLIRLVKRLSRGSDMVGFLARLASWEHREAKKALAAEREERARYVHDQAEAIRELSDDLEDIDALIDRIEELFADDGRPAVVCSTVHKAKGLEAPRIFILEKTLYFGKGRGADSPVEEKNIEYVAITRAQRELVWVQEYEPPKGAK